MAVIVSKGIGGSQAAAALGVSSRKSQMELWLEKTGRKPKKEINEELAHFGNVMEEVIAQEFSRRTGKKVRKESKMLQNPDYPFMIGYIDRRIVGEKTFLECKNTSEWAAKEFKNEDIPLDYWIQCQHYMTIMRVDYCYLATLIGGNSFKYFKVDRNKMFCEKMIELEQKFWESVLNDVPPKPKDFEDIKIFVEHFFEPDEKKIIELNDDEFIGYVEKIQDLESKIKEMKNEVDFLKTKIKETMQDATVAIIGDYEVIWKPQVRKSIDTRRLKQERPEIYQEFIKESETRTFRIKEAKA